MKDYEAKQAAIDALTEAQRQEFTEILFRCMELATCSNEAAYEFAMKRALLTKE